MIGAGLAGLTAAYRIQSLTNHHVSVYEARFRPGGRVHTLYLENGSFEELGAKFITDGAHPECITKLIRELDLQITSSLIELNDRSYILGNDFGAYYPIFKDVLEPTQELYDKLKGLPGNTMSTLLDLCVGPVSVARELAEEFLRSYEGRDSDELSTWFLTSFWDFYKDRYYVSHGQPPVYEEDYILGGNSLLVQRLVERLHTPIQYASPLQKIARNENGGFQLVFPNKNVDADIVVLAIPGSLYGA